MKPLRYQRAKRLYQYCYYNGMPQWLKDKILYRSKQVYYSLIQHHIKPKFVV